jgi:hypothetical protein
MHTGEIGGFQDQELCFVEKGVIIGRSMQVTRFKRRINTQTQRMISGVIACIIQLCVVVCQLIVRNAWCLYALRILKPSTAISQPNSPFCPRKHINNRNKECARFSLS